MRLTISDIAKKTGYAKSTVSAALNNKPGVKPKTREEIRRIAAEMNYVPNEFARNLSMRTANTIGIIVRDITNPFYAKICRAVENIASEHGYELLPFLQAVQKGDWENVCGISEFYPHQAGGKIAGHYRPDDYGYCL